MRIDILTLFPSMFTSFLETSLIAHANKLGILDIHPFDIRIVTTDVHKKVDNKPFGGGPGMLLRVDIIDLALQAVIKLSNIKRSQTKIILITPQGQVFNQKIAKEHSQYHRLIFICGHYEGFDERIRDLVDMELSLGDFVLTGGELPVQVMIDAIARFVPGFLGKQASHVEESFEVNELNQVLLEYPQYTQPVAYNGKEVPEILRSGNHGAIKKWRMEKSLEKTKKNRPDLLSNHLKLIDKPEEIV